MDPKLPFRSLNHTVIFARQVQVIPHAGELKG
jgi:hypothetical protein